MKILYKSKTPDSVTGRYQYDVHLGQKCPEGSANKTRDIYGSSICIAVKAQDVVG